MHVTGSIPKRIRFWCQQQKYNYTYNNNNHLGVPAFAADVDNPKTNETARRWSEGYVHANSKVEILHPNEEFDNTPFVGVRILGLQNRERSGNVFKAVVKDKFVFDFRDEVLFDAINSPEGIKDGQILCPVLFAMVGSNMRLIVENSPVHKALIELTVAKAKKKIPDKELVVGGIYSTSSGGKQIYCGRFMHMPCEEKRTYGGCYRGNAYTLTWAKPEEVFVFARLDDDEDKYLKPITPESYFFLNYKRTNSMNQFYGMVPERLPADMVAFTHELCVKKLNWIGYGSKGPYPFDEMKSGFKEALFPKGFSIDDPKYQSIAIAFAPLIRDLKGQKLL